MLRNCLALIALVIIVVAIYFPGRHARRYSYIPTEDIFKNLVLEKPEIIDPNLPNCSYQSIIAQNVFTEISKVNEKQTYSTPMLGGEHIPVDCTPLIKTAIIVPYRQREKDLRTFLNYMHNFLQRQKLHYRIFIVDQNDKLPFNRAKMLNYGAKFAIKLKYGCLILHDVDLIPINSGNIYGCTKMPRHMSSSLDTFRYNLPYLTLFGGAVAILSSQFERINGMSNKFYGWGAEDDDFWRRLTRNGYEPCRFAPEINRYIMLMHEKETPSKNRFNMLLQTEESSKSDGLNSLSQKYLVKHEDLYTHVYAS